MSDSGSDRETLRWQFELVWRLAGYHLPLLTDEECLWEPAAGSWTVRMDADGAWRADRSEPVPNPAPPVTIAWLTWHILWWWGSAIAAARNLPVAPRETVRWPGSADATIHALDAFAAQWSKVLQHTGSRASRRISVEGVAPAPAAARLANCELMKTVAEIGVVRHLFAASPHTAT